MAWHSNHQRSNRGNGMACMAKAIITAMASSSMAKISIIIASAAYQWRNASMA